MEQRRYRGLRDLVEESLLSFGQSLVGELEYVTPVVAYPVSGKPDRVETDLRCGVIVASMKHPIRPPSQWTGREDHHAEVNWLFYLNCFDLKNTTEFIGNHRVLDYLYDETGIVVEERLLLSRILR